jgi:hypothetical protein
MLSTRLLSLLSGHAGDPFVELPHYPFCVYTYDRKRRRELTAGVLVRDEVSPAPRVPGLQSGTGRRPSTRPRIVPFHAARSQQPIKEVCKCSV